VNQRYDGAPRLPDGEEIDPRALLGSGESPIELEIGPGRGSFLIERLEKHPDVFLLGLEIRRKWAAIVDDRLRARGLAPRGRVFAEDARSALRRLQSGTVRVVFLHFPDPWWKKRHAKRRVATGDLLVEIARVLVPGGELFYQSDVAERASDFDAIAAEHFVPWGDTASVPENPYGAASNRERRARADGLPVIRLRYRARNAGTDGPRPP
jgi:tRNA (guanine-N7-)-methyltransferase